MSKLLEYKDWCDQVEAEVLAEVEASDPVHRQVRYTHFISKSKGRGRKRRIPKYVRLVSYRHGQFYTWSKFPFDEYATECLGDIEDAEAKFIDRIEAMG